MELRKGDIVQFKKQHPCGENRWEILRVGMDFRLKCKGCGHMVMMPRKEAEKKIVKVLERNGGEGEAFRCAESVLTAGR